jgi:hypothetical protein
VEFLSCIWHERNKNYDISVESRFVLDHKYIEGHGHVLILSPVLQVLTQVKGTICGAQSWFWSPDFVPRKLDALSLQILRRFCLCFFIRELPCIYVL